MEPSYDQPLLGTWQNNHRLDLFIVGPGLVRRRTDHSSKGSTQQVWKGRFALGALPLEQGAALKIAVTQDQVLFESTGISAVTVPASAITGILYDHKAHNLAGRWLKGTKGVWTAAGTPLGLIAAGLVIGTGAAVLAPFDVNHHFIHIVWIREDQPELLVIEAEGNQYVSLLDDLQRVSGTAWTSLPSERKQVRKDLKKAKKKKVEVYLNRSVWFATTKLPAGLYQTVFLQRKDDKGLMCFFRGTEVKQKTLMMTASVRLVSETNWLDSSPGVVYERQGELVSLVKILLPDRTFDFR